MKQFTSPEHEILYQFLRQTGESAHKSDMTPMDLSEDLSVYLEKANALAAVAADRPILCGHKNRRGRTRRRFHQEMHAMVHQAKPSMRL